jgi:hypothetical protein
MGLAEKPLITPRRRMLSAMVDTLVRVVVKILVTAALEAFRLVQYQWSCSRPLGRAFR